jgi:hypothetical protein
MEYCYRKRVKIKKMKKYKIILGIFIMCMMFTLFGCGAEEIKSINDFSRFSDIIQETDKIDITFDNNTGTPFNF